MIIFLYSLVSFLRCTLTCENMFANHIKIMETKIEERRQTNIKFQECYLMFFGYDVNLLKSHCKTAFNLVKNLLAASNYNINPKNEIFGLLNIIDENSKKGQDIILFYEFLHSIYSKNILYNNKNDQCNYNENFTSFNSYNLFQKLSVIDQIGKPITNKNFKSAYIKKQEFDASLQQNSFISHQHLCFYSNIVLNKNDFAYILETYNMIQQNCNFKNSIFCFVLELNEYFNLNSFFKKNKLNKLINFPFVELYVVNKIIENKPDIFTFSNYPYQSFNFENLELNVNKDSQNVHFNYKEKLNTKILDFNGLCAHFSLSEEVSTLNDKDFFINIDGYLNYNFSKYTIEKKYLCSLYPLHRSILQFYIFKISKTELNNNQMSIKKIIVFFISFESSIRSKLNFTYYEKITNGQIYEYFEN